MKIKNLKLIKEGYEGVQINHITTTTKGDTNYDVYRSDKYTHPVTIELENSMDKLKIHLLKLVRCWPTNWDLAVNIEDLTLNLEENEYDVNITEIVGILNDLLITTITYDGEKFSLVGTLKSVDNRKITFNTGAVNPETDYEYFQLAKEQIEKVYVCAANYVADEPINQLTNTKGYVETTPTNVPQFDL
tara:strand:+ start:1303 stop:1869 length:567 start_codon:yes stop_codon:yes gene_type:complete